MQSQLQECSKFSSWKQQFDLFVDESNLWSCGRDNEEEETMTLHPQWEKNCMEMREGLVLQYSALEMEETVR